jgi:hypothetical protein
LHVLGRYSSDSCIVRRHHTCRTTFSINHTYLTKVVSWVNCSDRFVCVSEFGFVFDSNFAFSPFNEEHVVVANDFVSLAHNHVFWTHEVHLYQPLQETYQLNLVVNKTQCLHYFILLQHH